MIRKMLALAGLVLTLDACTGPPPPTYSADAFKGIYNRSSTSVPTDAPVTVTAPVGVIFSENVETYIGYIKDSTAYWGSVVPASLTNTVAVADNDPIYFAGRTLVMLKNRFPSAQKVHDFGEAVSTGKKSVVLIDMKLKPMQPYGDRTTRVEIDAYFFDSTMNPVSKLVGQGAWAVPFASLEMGVQKSIDQALAQINEKMALYVR